MSLSTHLFLLLLFLPFTFQLTEAQSNGNYLIEVSGEDNVEGRQQTTAMLTKFRMLFGLLTCRSKHRSKQQLSPQPEPPDAAEKIPPPLAPPHRLPAHRKAPPPLQIHMLTVQGPSTARRKHIKMIVAISASVLATLAIFGAIKLLTRQQHKGRSAGSSNKVSFDPEPEIHYLDSLAPFIEIDSDHKLSSESKSVVSVDNILSPPLLNEELPIESILDVEDHSENAAHCANSLSSDDNESFHSACCSHCSSELTPTAFEPSSPRCRLTTFFIARAKKSKSSSNAIASNTPSSEIYIEPLPSSQFPRLEMSPASSWSSSKHSKSSNPQEKPSELASADNMDSTKPLQTLKSIPGPPPQPPSVSGGSIPKPPPPPSFRKNTPLPPSQPWPHSPPTDKDGNPLPKLKPLHWEKVRAAPDRCMVWDKIRSRSFELDEKTIESLFGYNAHCSARNEESKIKNSSPGKLVLEQKRLQNFTILLKALNATAEQVCNSLILGSGLSTQQLETLAKMVPTKEEEEKLYKYEGDIAELGSTEKFLKVILCIPSAFSRIEVMLYKATFGDEVTHLKKSFKMLEEACEELRSSRLFLRLLEAVLMTGNRMNIGTTRGGARAFKLDALLKLADIKGTDGKTTLLHFVVQEMIKSEGFNAYEKKNEKTLTKSKIANEREECYNARGLELVSRLSSELCNVKKTASMDLDALGSSVSNLSNGISKLKEIVKEDELSSNGRDGGFLNSLRSFQKHGEGVIWELKDCEDRVFRHVREITEYYHGNVSKDEVNPLRIFVIVSDFLGMLDRVCKEIKISKAPQTLNLNVHPSRGSS